MLLQNGAKSIYKILQQIQLFKKPEYSQNWNFRSIASITDHHPDLATVFHEQMENYLQNWDVKEYAYACCPDESMDRFKDFDKHDITLRSDFQPCLVAVSDEPADLDMELTEFTKENILKSI